MRILGLSKGHLKGCEAAWWWTSQQQAENALSSNSNPKRFDGDVPWRLKKFDGDNLRRLRPFNRIPSC